MNPIKKKLADFLNEMSKKAVDSMDPESTTARSLKNPDKDALLKKDIQRICEGVSILEAVKIMRLSTKLMVSNTEYADKYRKEIKSIAFEVVKRVEKKTGNLMPESRDLLMNL